MKNIFKKLTLLAVLFSFISFSGCDELSKLPLNIPLDAVYFSSTTNDNSSTDNNSVCLSSSDEWLENLEDVQSVQFVSASFWADEGTTSGLTGDIQLVVREGMNSNGAILFVWTYENLVAANHVDDPLEITLTEEQLEMVNNYLGTFKNGNDLCFYIEFTSSNLDGQGPPFTINSHVQFVIEAELEL